MPSKVNTHSDDSKKKQQENDKEKKWKKVIEKGKEYDVRIMIDVKSFNSTENCIGRRTS